MCKIDANNNFVFGSIKSNKLTRVNIGGLKSKDYLEANQGMEAQCESQPNV